MPVHYDTATERLFYTNPATMITGSRGSDDVVGTIYGVPLPVMVRCARVLSAVAAKQNLSYDEVIDILERV